MSGPKTHLKNLRISDDAGQTSNSLSYDVDFITGLYLVTTGSATDVTIIYE